MNIKNKLLDYFHLLRFHAAASEPVIMLIGALIMNERDLSSLFVIFLIGLFYHIYGYVLNDYADVEIDKKSVELKNKPLVSGSISKRNAMIITALSFLFAYILTFIYFRSIFPMVFLSIAMLLGGVYDLYGKKIPGLSDLVIAGSLAFSFIFGASTVSVNFSSTIYVMWSLVFFGIVFINVVEGGLKDVDHDSLREGKTLASIAGVKVVEGKLVLTWKFKASAYILICICLFLIFFLGLQSDINFWNSSYLNWIIACVLLFFVILGIYLLLHLSIFNRSKIKRLYALINGGAGALIIIMFLPVLGLDVTLILLLLPVTWYVVFNVILYRKPLQPEV